MEKRFIKLVVKLVKDSVREQVLAAPVQVCFQDAIIELYVYRKMEPVEMLLPMERSLSPSVSSSEKNEKSRPVESRVARMNQSQKKSFLSSSQ